MKTDLYTKIMLTIIAGALLYLCFAKNPAAVRADSDQKAQEAAPQKVIIVGEDLHGSLPVTVQFVGVDGRIVPAGKDFALPVVVRQY